MNSINESKKNHEFYEKLVIVKNQLQIQKKKAVD